MSGSKVSISGIGSGDTTARVEALVQALAHQAFADQAFAAQALAGAAANPMRGADPALARVPVIAAIDIRG